MRNPLTFTRSDRRAVIALALLIVVCVAGLILFGESPQTDADNSLQPTAHKQFVSSSRTETIEGNEQPATDTSTELSNTSKQQFDPNTVDSATLVHIGISPRKVHTFMRYRASGARFAKPEDIARCYSFSDDDIDKLLPLVCIAPKYRHSNSYKRTKYPIQETYQSDESPENHSSATNKYQSNKFTTLTSVDVNTADTALLKRIPGIGDAISSMIINLRERLGGFTSLSQLTQIRQLTPEHMEWFTLADTVPFRRIQINKASFKTLVSHPYISKEQANGILHYIRIYGPIKDVKTLGSTALFSAQELNDLTPYLEF